METRVALIGIIVEQESSAAALNALLHESGVSAKTQYSNVISREGENQ